MNGNRYGRGPYTAIVCPPSQEFVARLAETLRDFREAAAHGTICRSSRRRSTLCTIGRRRGTGGDFAQAVR